MANETNKPAAPTPSTSSPAPQSPQPATKSYGTKSIPLSEPSGGTRLVEPKRGPFGK